MLFLLSPAKSLDYDTPVPEGLPHTTPQFVPQSTALIEVLREQSPQQIASLMELSDTLAALNVARYQAWRPRFTAHNSRQAVLAFNGDVYEGLQARSLSAEDQWWVELLETGVLWGTDGNRPDRAVSNGYEVDEDVGFSTRRVKRKGLFDQAREISPRLKGSSDQALGRYLSKHKCDNTGRVLRKRGWTFPPLDEARADWLAHYPGWKWRDPDLREWQNEG